MDVPMYECVDPRPSGRKGSKKVRTGCVTCNARVRKVKCDEAKPFCLRCVKTGRRCDGYVSPQPAPSTDLVLSPNLIEIDSPAGRRAFDYYRGHSASLLGGSVDKGFWGGLVLRLSVTEPAVQHAVLALSSLHEAMSSRRDDGRQLARAFTFSEYGKAITAMRTWDSTKSPLAIPLLVCVLFTCIEFMMEHDATSQLHICQGRQILTRLQESRSPAADLIRREIVPVYARLSLASFLFGSQPAPIPTHLRSSASVPDEFSSLSEARGHLYHLMDEGLQFTVRARPATYSPSPDRGEMDALEARQRALLSELRQWQNAFAVLATKLVPSQSSTATQSLLQMHHHTTNIWIAAGLSAREMGFDAHVSSFAAIISLSSSIINAQGAAFRATGFTFETELIAPLYWVVLKCRHPLLRRSALRLLRRDELRNRKENLWDASVVAAVAARVLEVEEGDVSADWPVSEGSSGGSPASGERSEMGSTSPEALSVPISGPPSLRAPYIARQADGENPADILLTTELEDFNYASLHHASPSPPPAVLDAPRSSIHADKFITEPPYGIPEGRRVQNTLIGQRVPEGIHATMFKYPAGGQVEWNIKTELLRV